MAGQRGGMFSAHVIRKLAGARKIEATYGTFLSARAVMPSLHVCSQGIATGECHITLLTVELSQLRMNCGSMSIKVGLLVERMPTYVTHVWLFLQRDKEFK